MSHLICPLCGKNAPLSTFNPENLPLDIVAVSFKGLGRGKGFAVNEKISLMDDEEYTPLIIERIVRLYNLFLEKGSIKTPSSVSEIEQFNQIEQIQSLLVGKNIKINDLKNELEIIKEKYEIQEMIEYIIRESFSLINGLSQIVAREDGWYINLSSDPNELEAYLFIIAMKIPANLKDKLLRYILHDDNPLLYKSIKELPREQIIAERIMDSINNKNTFIYIDEEGNKKERIVKPNNDPNYTLKSISFNDLKKIVRNTKKQLKSDPNYIGKTLLDILHPEKIKLPYRIQDTNI